MINKKVCYLLIINGLFLFIDRFLKYQAVHGWHLVRSNSYFGWWPYFNKGIGFGIPVPNEITIGFSVIILAIVAYLLFREAFSVKCQVLSILSFVNFYRRGFKFNRPDIFWLRGGLFIFF